MIPPEKVAEIRERADLVALVGEYVRLKRSGASFKGLCPFHSEKTPSFYVHPARGFFHCFGCGASGDAIAFVSRLEGLSFPEAVRWLAEREGITVEEVEGRAPSADRAARRRRERLLSLLESAADFYVRQIEEHPLGAMAREELRARGITEETASRFALGYAPAGWDALAGHLRAKGFSPADAEQVGLLVPRRGGSGYYDRFRHRLLFPLRDTRGRIVAFSGRALPPPPGQEETGREPPAKYINSPEHPLYRKGELLYGLHEGRVSLRRLGWAVLCEGNFDLVAMHQAGLHQAVAPLGTAFTGSHARLLRRFVERVVLLFDADSAGRKAAREAGQLLLAEGLSVRVATLPAGEDPDSFLRQHGAEALRHRLEAARDLVEHLMDEGVRAAAGDPREKARQIAALGPLLAGLDNPVEARLYVERIAQRFGVGDVEAVRRQLREGARRARRMGRNDRPEGRAESTPASNRDAPRRTSQLPRIERELVGILLDQPVLFEHDEAKKLRELLTNPDLRAIFDSASLQWTQRRGVDGPALIETVQAENVGGWLRGRLAVQRYDDPESAATVLREGMARLARRHVERELPRLREAIVAARRRGDEAEAERLTRQREALFRSARQWLQQANEPNATR